jgi:ATP-binding cassette subfamily C protein CydD
MFPLDLTKLKIHLVDPSRVDPDHFPVLREQITRIVKTTLQADMSSQQDAHPKADTQMLEQMMGAARGKVRLASMLSAASSLIWPLQAGVVAMAISGLLGPMEEPGPLAAASVFVLLGLARAVLNHQAERLLFAGGVTIVTRAREEIVRREMRTTDSGSAASTAVLASEKLDHIIPYVTRYAPAQARVMTVPLVILALSFWFSWAAGLVLLVTGPLIPVFMALVGLAAKEASQRQMADIGTLNDLLIDRLSALVDIRLLDAGPAMIADFAASADQLRSRTMNVLKIAFLSSTVLELFAAIGVAMMAVYVGFALLGAIEFGSYAAPLTPAAGIFLLLLAPDFYQPLRDLSAAWHDKAAALAVAGEFSEWRARTPPELVGKGGASERLPGTAEIILEGVAVRIGDRVIRYPDISIQAGESVALMGPSGAGKTTLLRLLAGLALPDEGVIHVAGQRLDSATADGWRARLGGCRSRRISSMPIWPTTSASGRAAIWNRRCKPRRQTRSSQPCPAAQRHGSEKPAAASPAAKPGVSPWRGPSSPGQTFCLPTNRPPISMPKPPVWSWPDWPGSSGKVAASSSPPMTRRLPPGWTGPS